MTDMSAVIVPKSDQINADDLIGGPRTITITGVKINSGSEQPVSISFDGGDGKVFRPCKSMSRVLVAMWGPDANKYVGRSLTLYRDPNVKWGGLAVGGIRISHMSDIAEAKTMALTETRAKRTPFTVKPLKNGAAAPTPPDPASKWTSAYLRAIGETNDLSDLEQFVDQRAAKLEELRAARPELAGQLDFAVRQRRSELSDEDPEQPAEVSEHETAGEDFAFEDELADAESAARARLGGEQG